jgi:uncharacterized membrane protein
MLQMYRADQGSAVRLHEAPGRTYRLPFAPYFTENVAAAASGPASRIFLIRWFPWFVLLLAFALRAYHLGYQSLWRDEVDAIDFATRNLSTVLSNFVKVGENGPLYFLLLRLWIGLTGTSELAVRYFSLFFGVLAAALLYALGRLLGGRRAAGFALLLGAASPYWVWYAQEAKMYALLTCTTVLSMLVYLQALRRGSARYWIFFWIVAAYRSTFISFPS